jgi:hypothetical protein
MSPRRNFRLGQIEARRGSGYRGLIVNADRKSDSLRGEERLSMSAAELSEFLAAMEIVRQANAALLDVAITAVDEDRDERVRLAETFISPTIH